MPAGGVIVPTVLWVCAPARTRHEGNVTKASTDRPNEADVEAALDWYERLQAPSLHAQAWEEFAGWLEAAPAHQLAFDMAEDLHATIDGHAGQILDLLPASPIGPTPSANESPKRWIAAVAIGAGAFLVAASLAIVLLPEKPKTPDEPVAYAAPAGQQREISLADGSNVDLSPGSLIRVQFDASSRRLLVDRGEALIRAGRDPSRPLVVLAGDVRIRDIGTLFDVALRQARVSVAVLSGMVSVSPDAMGSSGGTVTVAAGQQFVQTPGPQPSQVVPTDAAAVLSWRHGFLTYRDVPLSDVVADINRYFGAQVTLADAATGARRFSGVLKADNLDATLRRLSVLLALPVVRRGEILQLGGPNDGR
jgi:transmembrane sensor